MTDNFDVIPDNAHFALTGKDMKQVLDIVQTVKSHDRNVIMKLLFKDVNELYASLTSLEQVKVEHPAPKEVIA